MFLEYKSTRRVIQKVNFELIEKFTERQEVFKENWTFLKLQARVEVHVNNLSYEEMKRLTMEKFLQRQNAQITRIFSLKDPLVSVIYVAPFDLQSEIMNYFYKILELGEIANYKQRLHFIWPENHSRFPTHYSTTQLLLLSPKALKRIRTLIRNKPAYIVPGVPSKDDIKLSNALEVPLFSGSPQVQQVHCTKSGAKRLFNELQIPTAPGAFEIYDEKELINTLSILIVNNPTVCIWVLKIEDETEGRGIAWVEVRNLGSVMKDKSLYNTQEGVMRVAAILATKLKNKLQIAYPSLYRSYAEYVLAFTRKGGIVEACPKCPLS